MAKVPRYVQNEIIQDVPSALPLIEQEGRQRKANFDKAVALVAKGNEMATEFVENQFVNTQSLKFKELLNDASNTYRNVNASSPVNDGSKFRSVADKTLDNILQDAPTGNSKYALRKFASGLIENETENIKDWGQEQNIKNWAAQNQVAADSLATRARTGEDVGTLAADLDQLVVGLAASNAAPDGVAKFRANNRSEIAYNYGLHLGEQDPQTLRKYLDKKEVTSQLKPEHLSGLENLYARESNQRPITALRKSVELASNPTKYYVDEGKWPVLDFSKPDVYKKQIQQRDDALIKGDPKSRYNILHDVEVAAFQEIYNSQNSDKAKATIATQLMKSVPVRYQTSLFNQFRKEDKGMAIAMAVSTTDPLMAEKIIKGDTLVKAKLQDSDIETFKKQFTKNGYLKDVVLDETRKDLMYDTALRMFAYETKNSSLTAGNSDHIDKLADQIFGPKVKFKGKTLIPFKRADGAFATERDFDNIMDVITDQDLKTWGVAPTSIGQPLVWEQIKDAVIFENAGGNRYRMLVNGQSAYNMQAEELKIDLQALQTRVGK